ncbi:mismatch repair protein [Saccharomycopsis crataegensis]|uniref:Mismatch repair protein n=1 Tax=Saccharomycopsis crataegensis TaxID=43959 RepID=A0AAV5QHD3_9ASCO|nr:mismatch repair protein [Saccharomycopsis crataegensis]
MLNILSEESSVSILSSSSIFSPVTVVRELIDNALDADASNITIEVDFETAGLSRISVKDNGWGIFKEDRAAVCRRNSTSKIETMEDIKLKMSSLGFRGEALFFLASLCGNSSPLGNRRMIIASKSRDDTVGEQWHIDGQGEIIPRSKKTIPIDGTSVTIFGLFDSLPVRKKFLMKKRSSTISSLRELVISYGMINARKAKFSLKFTKHNAKGQVINGAPISIPAMIINKSDSKINTLSELCGVHNLSKEVVSGTMELFFETSDISWKISFILPIMKAQNKVISSQRSVKVLSVNGRVMSLSMGFGKRVAKMVKGIYTGLGLLAPNNWYAELSSDNATGDVNIEPEKCDITLDFEDEVLNELEEWLINKVEICHQETNSDLDHQKQKNVERPKVTYVQTTRNINNNTIIDNFRAEGAADDMVRISEKDLPELSGSDDKFLEDDDDDFIQLLEKHSNDKEIKTGVNTLAIHNEAIDLTRSRSVSSSNVISSQRNINTVSNTNLDIIDDVTYDKKKGDTSSITASTTANEDWCFSMADITDDTLLQEYASSNSNEDISALQNEDLSLSKDISISNPFVLSKLKSSMCQARDDRKLLGSKREQTPILQTIVKKKCAKDPAIKESDNKISSPNITSTSDICADRISSLREGHTIKNSIERTQIEHSSKSSNNSLIIAMSQRSVIQKDKSSATRKLSSSSSPCPVSKDARSSYRLASKTEMTHCYIYVHPSFDALSMTTSVFENSLRFYEIEDIDSQTKILQFAQGIFNNINGDADEVVKVSQMKNWCLLEV